MGRIRGLTFLALLCACAIPAVLTGDDSESLFRKSRSLAHKGEYAECLRVMKDAFLQRLPQYRGLSFKHPVEVGLMREDKLREYLLEDLEAHYPDAEFEKDDLVLAHFGLAEPGASSKKTMVSLFSEEVAGFYDPDKKQLFLIDETPPKGEKPKKPSLWSKIFGGGGFDWGGNRSVLSHELAHALADQHYDLLSMQTSVEKDDDMLLATTALVEGEAMVVMLLDSLEPSKRELARSLRSVSFSGKLMNLMMAAALPFATGETFRDAPLVTRETMIFPYTQGLIFCGELTKRGNWELLDKAFRDPPTSTEQILHPEKWHPDSRDEPVVLSFEDEFPLPTDRWELVEENVVGELVIGILLRPALGGRKSRDAAAGWDGDTYRVYRDSKSESTRTVLVWTTTWDDEKEASEFADALWTYSKSRGSEESEAPLSVPGAEPTNAKSFQRDIGRSAIWREGKNVWLIDQAPEGHVAKLVAWSRKLERSAKVFKLRKKEPKVNFPSAPKAPGEIREF